MRPACRSGIASRNPCEGSKPAWLSWRGSAPRTFAPSLAFGLPLVALLGPFRKQVVAHGDLQHRAPGFRVAHLIGHRSRIGRATAPVRRVIGKRRHSPAPLPSEQRSVRDSFAPLGQTPRHRPAAHDGPMLAAKHMGMAAVMRRHYYKLNLWRYPEPRGRAGRY